MHQFIPTIKYLRVNYILLELLIFYNLEFQNKLPCSKILGYSLNLLQIYVQALFGINQQSQKFGSALRGKPLKNDGMKPLKIQNCMSSTQCYKQDNNASWASVRPYKGNMANGEFFEFRFHGIILGLDLTAQNFWFFFFMKKEQKVVSKNVQLKLQ